MKEQQEKLSVSAVLLCQKQQCLRTSTCAACRLSFWEIIAQYRLYNHSTNVFKLFEFGKMPRRKENGDVFRAEQDSQNALMIETAG